MSLTSALISATDIKVNKGILTLSERESITFSCFLQDIQLFNPILGNGKIVEFRNNKFICDFDYSSVLQEIKAKTLIHYLN